MSALLSRLLPVLVALLLVCQPARAQEDEPEAPPTVFERADAFFGTHIVGNMAMVMFWDILFWDNNLAAGDGVGQVVGDEQITGYDPEKGYLYQKQITVKEPVLFIDPAQRKTFGKIEVDVRTGTRTDGDEKAPILVGHILEQDVDLAAVGLEPVEEGTDVPDAEAIVAVPGLADFSVRVDRRTAKVVPADIVLPPHFLEVTPGASISLAGEAAEVLSMNEDGSALVLAPTVRTDATRLPNPENAAMPIVVLWLVLGSIFFTLRMQFVNLWAFAHAIRVTAGHYDNPEDEGEISHFQALSSALSATVGLGNIAGVAIAVSVGGPGAIFWMVMAGFLGMTSKFTECTLGQMYRVTRPDGSVSGGPMHYLDKGLAELGLAPLGKVLAWMFAIMCVGGSLGGGNMFQANQSYAAVASVVPFFADKAWLYGIILVVLVAMVIMGGIKRIGATAGAIVPLMCTVYLLAGLWVVIVNADAVPGAISAIIGEAFNPQAGLGGMIGVLAQGFKRASFSSEAGVGSASIAHSAASTPYAVREGIVSLLEPFIDTIVVCAMTGIVVVVTGAYQMEGVGDGVLMTSKAFETALWWFPNVLSFAVLMFAFSTMISWSYYGERATTWMFGESMVTPYRVLFLFCVFCGSVFNLGSVLDFSDLMILAMAFPNILGAVLLSGKVKAALDDYWRRLKAGEFDTAA